MDKQILDIVSKKDKKKPRKKMSQLFVGGSKKTMKRKAPAPKGTHTMPDGTIMSGKTHSKDSKVVKAAPSPKNGRGKRSGY